MKERLFNSCIAKISEVVDPEQVSAIRKILASEFSNYEISARETHLVPYDSVPECVKIYLDARKIEGVKMSTLGQYSLRLRQFFQMTHLQVQNVQPNDIRSWLFHLQANSKGMSDRTLANARTIVCTFFKWACSEGYISKDPSAGIRSIRYKCKERESLSEEELEILRSACDDVRTSAIVETLYSTGCRVSELILLKISDVDFERGEVALFGKGDKHRKSYINAKAKLALTAYLQSRTDDSPYLFVSVRKRTKMNLTKNTIEGIISDLGVKAGLKRRVYPHLIRHTTATIWLNRGMDVTDVQKMLGHVNINTTMVYAHVADSSVKHSHGMHIV